MLPVFSKIFERLTLNRMESFISRLNILTPSQFGFQKGKSTSLAVIKLVTHVVQAYHQKTCSACDTVNHKLLMKKLEHHGFRGQCSEYLHSYFSNRRQYVQVDGLDSSYMLVSYANDATLLPCIPSPNMRSDVTESLNRDLSKISAWCNLWGMRLYPNKTQSMIVSRSRTVFPPHPDLLVGSTSLNFCESFFFNYWCYV